MIVDFSGEETEKIFNGEVSTKLAQDMQDTARRKLRMLHAAINYNDLRQPPGNRLEKLKGSRESQCSIRINDQWRICFVWHEGNASHVEVVDYH